MLTASSKQRDVAKSKISPVLFLTVDGEPMSFFLRPGPVKRKLQPLITAGGGLLCNVQQPGAILLINPEERGSIPETTAHWYVSTQYIINCVEKDEQLNLEDYRLNPGVDTRHSARLNNSKESSGFLGGRVAYTPEDDAAILNYVREHNTEVGGNRLWQEMEKQRVTSHSWQSMKYRYRVRLAKKRSEVVEDAPTEEDTKEAEEETKVEGNQETDVAQAAASPWTDSTAADPLQTHSVESDLTQIEDLSIPAESTQQEIVEAQTSASPGGEVQHVSPQIDKQPTESTQAGTVEAETPNSPQITEDPCVDPLTDAHPIPAESTEPETDEPQTIVSPQKESAPEDSPAAQPRSLPDTSSQKKPKEKQKASPEREQPQRRFTRRQLQLEELLSPKPYGKKLRSASSSAEQPSSSPQPSKKTKSAVKSALQKDTTADQPPSKRARGKSTAAVEESQQEEITESSSVPQKGEKKKEKRKLGILELATKEFEDESEFEEDEAPDLQNPTATGTIQPILTDSTSDTAEPVSTQSNNRYGPSLQEEVQETQTSTSSSLPQTRCPEPVATKASEAHLFIFDSESQEEDSQSIVGESTVALAKQQPRIDKDDAAFSLTQVQLEENKQRIRELMNKTKQDLASVTKALLKTSGDFSAALDLLLNPSSFSALFWDRCDDSLLHSADLVVRQQLLEKYGEEAVAKRIVFLEIER
ncbi:telomeric repeat-binding factor 2-interacting protein 1 [Micropterus dolomieu]|uniref:telomeric repeat-binding factor 2-interacting protein 1 n=1 Tax=Micropterus dolomieu TaxID=147949 RepID=UPI001E8D6BEB|nr:telomeric repeat-binding factor 2-interacting protein 1 [Micropterus dolomieu]